MKYHEISNGEWVQPRRRGYYMKCCDCGLVHRMNFAVVNNPRGRGVKILFQAFRVPRRGIKSKGSSE